MSIIIPNRNGGDQLLNTLKCAVDAARQAAPLEVEFRLVDDGSTDGSPLRVREAFPQVSILSFERSRGAAFARNAGLQAAGGASLFCLDADVACGGDCLARLVASLAAADIVFPTLVSPEGRVLAPTTAFARRTCLDSALFGIRRAALLRMDGLFDETIEIYGEDNDFFLRAARLGLRLRHVPEARAIHPSPATLSARHYHLTVRNAIYVWLKLRGLVDYWMPMDAWIVLFMAAQLLAGLTGRAAGGRASEPVARYAADSRQQLLREYARAIAWNIRRRDATLARHRAFKAFLRHENPDS